MLISWILKISILISVARTNVVLGAHINDVSPDAGSLGGETRITIHGGGFSADQFSQNDDPNTGNFVFLVSESGTRVDCPVHKDGSTEDMITCYTPEKMSEEEYYVKAIVDGVAIDDASLCDGQPTSRSCAYKPGVDNTPTIDSLTPQSGLPGGFVTVTGQLVTDRYGSNVFEASNERTEKLLRVYVGPQDCALKDGDDFYGLSVEEDSNYGSLMCRTKGTSVGFFNASFIVETPFGRSLPAPLVYRVSYNDQIYMYQTYTDISSISPSSGSTEGGLTLTIYGNYFDDKLPYTQPKVFVGDSVCEVTRVVPDELIECTVAAEPTSSASNYQGNRGVLFEYWTSTSKTMDNIDDVLYLTSSDAGYNYEFLDEAYHIDVNDTMDNYVSMMTMYFTPPHDGDYQFQMLADDGAKLFVDEVEATNSTTGVWGLSERMPLVSTNKYLLKVVHYEAGGESSVELKAKYFDTRFTSKWTQKAEQEEQTISIRSTVVYDVQELTFSGFTAETATYEVQTIEIQSEGSFRFGLFDVYTEPLTKSASETMVADAINALPVWGTEEPVKESVTVVRLPQTSDEITTYQITFGSKRGDFPLLDVIKVANDTDVTVTRTETTKGVPDQDTVSLTMEGAVSMPFVVSTTDSSSLEATLDAMFGSRCPSVFENTDIKKSFESFESYKDTFSGERVKDTEPFCGRYSLKNPWKIFGLAEEEPAVTLTRDKMLCFAYKGIFSNSLWLEYTYTEAGTEEVKRRFDWFSYTFNKDSDTESYTWYYTCINILDLVLSSRPDDSLHKLEAVYVRRLNSDNDAYIDAVFIGQDVTTDDTAEINRRRLRPAMPNGALIDRVTVTSSVTDVYTVTLQPFDCGNQFPLFELTNGEIQSGPTASPSTAASYRLKHSDSGSLSVSRTSAASPPVQNTIDVTFNGNTKSGLDVTLDAIDFGKELESLPGIGDLSVTKTDNCSNFDLRVTFESLPGDLPQMMVSKSNLEGIDVTASAFTNVDGGLLYDLTGDMVSTVETDPQVRVYINDVPTKCSGDCSFQWDSSVTPTVTGVTPTSGTSALGTSITVSGTRFSSIQADNTITIGDVDCTVTEATTTSITCDVGNGPVGDHKVMVNVAGKGFASHSSDIMFTYTANITGISPSAGSLGGGSILTISGYGFKDGATVAMGTGSCDVVDINADEITCTIPSTNTAGDVTVTVTQSSTTLTYSSYTYDDGLTATVSSVSPTSISVSGSTITIDGSSFGSSGSVYIGSQEAEVTSFTDTQIIVEIGAVQAGTQPIKVKTTNGLAVDGSGSIPSIDVELSVTNVYPLRGSLQGGTKLTITGAGFGSNDSLVDVSVGDFTCDVDTVQNTQIVCQIENMAVVHPVTNLGTHKSFGVYYAFDQPQLTIERGDIVHWSWETPDFVNDIYHSIIEVDSPSSTTAKEGGFSSGASRNGEFQYQFTELGTYYVWSGYVDQWGIKNYAGQIEVVEKLSSIGEISVMVSGIEALQDVGGSSNPTDSSACQSVTSAKSGCSDSLPSGGDQDKFNFAFWSCSTPVVDSISQLTGTAKTEISLSGEGFSTTDCQNEILFGDYPCDVVSSAESSVSCTMGREAEVELGVLHPLSVVVGNRGYALINIMSVEAKSFGLIPNIEDIQPTSGSMAGGAIITISGFGFGDSPVVNIDGYSCEIIESSYTEILCHTPSSSSESEKTIEVHATVNGSPQPAECQTSTMTCRYSYASLWTPVVTAVEPDSLSAGTTFTITGSNLGTETADLEVMVGSVSATVDSTDGTTLVASVQNVAAGNNDVIVRHVENGKADGNLVVMGTADITSLTPSSGSIHGETEITISGNGFVENDTTITADGSPCTITSISLSQVTCSTPAHSAGAVDIVVTSNSVSYTAETFTYATGSTPTVTSVNPTSGLPGDTLTISGSNLAGGSVMVLLDDVSCNVTSGTSSQIQCTIGAHATGLVPVYVHVEELGASNNDVEFEYTLQLSSINPATGGTAGGQTVTLTGEGFSEDLVATVCGQTCTLKETTSSEYQCYTPANSAQTCDVVVTLNGLSKTLSNSYLYDADLTPTISGVTPSRGGTGGGTTITVSGSGFGSIPGDVSVTIAGSSCTVSTATDTELECVTGPHAGSVVADVKVEVSGNGIAQEASSGDSEFSYIDVWSSSYTWGGASPPAAGEFVVIPAGMTLLLDTDTPVLSFLLIQGGKLIFDEADIELQANIIMITDGGLLQVGTEEEPFQHKGIITLHGHHRSKELPIYGTKVLAVRNGSLELHGIEVPLTWTKLSATASAGDTTISLLHPVEWNVDDEIVIASTGHHHSQSENEKKTITAISADKMTLTLDSALEAQHLGTEETFDGTLVEFRAEVGLLTHNVVVRGNSDPDWNDEIEACPKGFNTGEFAVQTCFLGRFGDEIGSSQFGAMILVHAPEKDTHAAEARLSYIEVTFAGQAFRLGRYPVHFHLNGDMSTSYVRGLGIHHTFNRAVNIHGTHNTMIEKTVIYNIMGGALFLEDGIEHGNTFQYNLAVFVRESSSLLNDDITPASFWCTNPNNTYQHNAAAGGSHFGYWYRMHAHPEGPSFTEDVCPVHVPLGVFQNNSAHSFGWFGLWIFPDYFPLQDPCDSSSAVEPAVFRGLTAWNNDKGAEAVNSGALQFDDFVLVQNLKAGYEGKLLIDVPQYADNGAMVSNSLIVGTTTVAPDDTQGCTQGGIIFAYGQGFSVKNVRFVNFDDSSCATFRWARIDGTCNFLCGGYNYHTEGLSFTNVQLKAIYDWEWEGILVDKDGTLTGKPDNEWKVVPTTGSLPDTCEAAPEFSGNMPASICPPQYKFHRYSFNNIIPASIEGKNLLITNQFGTSTVQFAKKRITHKFGWMCALLDGETYHFEFEFAEQITNISYSGVFYEFEAEDYIKVRLNVKEYPDRFSFDGGNTFVNDTVGGLDPSTHVHGDWEWDNVNSEIRYLVHGTKRAKRGGPSMSVYEVDRGVSYTSYKCYYEDCIPPPDPNTVPPKSERPAVFDYWSSSGLWNMSEDGYVSNTDGSYGVPQDLDNVRIKEDTWVVVNSTINRLGTLLLEGVLEFADHPSAVYEISADFIIIKGGRLIIGWPEDPFDGLATIVLRGDQSTPYYVPSGDAPTVGSKAIAVFGGLDLFGKDVGITWTKLAATATAGSNQIVLADNVTWSVGDEIVIGASHYDAWETEVFQISAVSGDSLTLTLNDSLNYDHIAHSETFSNGQSVELAAPVGLLTRNIKIIGGEDREKLLTENYGARILVGLLSTRDRTYTGYARLSNVEFIHTGQDGFTETYDARFSVAYIATGTVSNVKPSSVTKCSFHDSFNSAVGAFGTSGLNITDNVAYNVLGNGIVTTSDDTRVTNNLLALLVWTGSYQDRFETFNFRWESGIEAIEANNLTLQDNMVVGAERMGFHVKTLDCDDTSGRYSNNHAYSNLVGVGILPTDDVEWECALFTGFTVWKSHDFGLYYQNDPSIRMDDNVVVESRQGIYTAVLGPHALSHQIVDKYANISNTLIVGTTSSFDCSKDVTPVNDNMQLSALARPAMAPNGGMIGMVFPNFMSKSNMAPGKPFPGIKAYNSLAGLMSIKNVTFAHYGDSACKGDYAVATNGKNDDLQHPIESEGIIFDDVQEDFKIIYHRPNVVKINGADCVDMDCDAMKKALFKDLDGSFLGHVGSVIPESEFEWDENPVRGLGDYRIPKEMVTDMDGNRIPYEDIVPYKGVIRNENCVYRETWHAYECFDDLKYEMLVIESMDADTETRRLSPVAVLGNGYVDLINGPQDHGWCSGYTCRKRVSLFHALVATDEDYLVHFTSVTPDHMRYMILNADESDAIKLTVWYSKPNRLDVFVDGDYVMATNARLTDGGQYVLDMPQGDEFTPTLEDAAGTNFFDKDKGLLSIIIKGPQIIEVKSSETIIVSFSIPALSVEDFFGDSIVENLASFLNIPLTKVRVVNILSASGSRRKRSSLSGRPKRSTGIVVEIEIGDEPASSVNVTVSDTLDYSSLLELAAEIVSECQVGDISSSFNISGGCNSVTVPAGDLGEEPIVYSTPTPDHLMFDTELEPEYEGVPLRIHPKIRVRDIANAFITDLGTSEYPWQLTASLQSGTGHPSAVLNGTLEVSATDGWFNFTDLSVSHMGTGYILNFNVTSPAAATNFSISSQSFDVEGRPIKANVAAKTAGDITKNSRFSVCLDLRDENTDDIITDIAWRNHTWTAEASVLGNPKYGSLNGVLTATFNPATGQALFPDLNITGFGIFYIQFHVVSSPPDFDTTLNYKMNIMNPAHVGMVPEEEYEIQVKFDVDYSKVLSSEDKQNEFEQMILSEYANLWPDVRIKSGRISEGSIVVTFVIDGSVADVNATAYSMCDSISNSTVYSFDGYDLTLTSYMTIDNQTFYGVTCGEIETSEDSATEEGLSVTVIVIICLVCLIMVIVTIGVTVWFCKKQQMKKAEKAPLAVRPCKLGSQSDLLKEGTYYIGHSNEKAGILSRENTFTSMGKAPSEVGTPRNPYFLDPYPNSLTNNPVAPTATEMYKEPLPGTPPTPRLIEPLEAEEDRFSKPATPPTGIDTGRRPSKATSRKGSTPYTGAPMRIIKFPRSSAVTNGKQGARSNARAGNQRSNSHSPFPDGDVERSMTPVGIREDMEI